MAKAPKAPAIRGLRDPRKDWRGTTSTHRSIVLLILSDNVYWGLYSSQANSEIVAGAIEGSGRSDRGSFSSSDGKDFNLEGLGIGNFDLNADYVARQDLSGGIRYAATGQEVTFQVSYDPEYDQVPSSSEIAGNYSGSTASAGGGEAANVSISAAGAMSGAGASGCTFSGTIAPRSHGNAYDVSVKFNGGICVNGTSTVKGVAYYDASNKQITSAALNSARTDGFIYVGEKP